MFVNILFDVLFVMFQLYFNFINEISSIIPPSELIYRIVWLANFTLCLQRSIYYHTVASLPKQSIYSNSYYILSLVLPIKKKIPNNYDLLKKLTLKNPTTEDEDVYELGKNIFLYIIFDILLSNILYIDILYAFEIFIRVTVSS